MKEHFILILLMLACTFLFVLVGNLRVRNNESLIESIKNINNNFSRREKRESRDLVRALIINVIAGIFASIFFFEINLKIYNNDIIGLNDKAIQYKILDKYPNYYSETFEIEQLISYKNCKEQLKDYGIVYEQLDKYKKKIYYEMCLQKDNLSNFTENIFILCAIYTSIIFFIYSLFIEPNHIITILQKNSIDFYICLFAYSFVLALLFNNDNSYLASVILVVASLILITLSKFRITHIGFFLGISIIIYSYYPLI